MLVRVLRDKGQPGMRWRLLRDGDEISATVFCPNEHRATLTNHRIAPDGSVSPSVVCPFEACGFHEHIQLAEWDPKA